MKLLKTVRLTGALLAGVLLSLISANAFAVVPPGGTAGGTVISNLATVNYQVGGVAQTAIGSSQTGNSSGAGTATTFTVDNKLYITVTTVDAADVQVSPSGTHVVLEYLVTNNGNETQGVSFTTIEEATATASPFGGNNDDFDATLTNSGDGIFVQKTLSGSAYASATDTASSIPQLIAGGTAHVFVVADIPTVQVDGDVSVIALVGQIAVSGASATYGTAPGANITADNHSAAWVQNPAVGAEQLIFADSAGTDDALYDGKSSSRDAFIVKSAKLTITKGAPVILADPTGDATPHSIPGAVVQYTVTIANSATATTNATSIALTDALPTNTSWGGSTGVSGTTGVGTLKVTTPGVDSGAQFACADGSVTTQAATGGVPYTAVSCDFTKTTANTITVSGVALKPGDTTTIVYTVTVN
ncbi:MAG TPA: hypothetical protein VGH91_14560 [Gammaproteobacteria bacterium]|jgi:hypothetical protein